VSAETNGFFIPMDALNELQVDSLRALVKDRKRGGSCDAIVRQDSVDRRYQIDWVSSIQKVSKAESVPMDLVEATTVPKAKVDYLISFIRADIFGQLNNMPELREDFEEAVEYVIGNAKIRATPTGETE